VCFAFRASVYPAWTLIERGFLGGYLAAGVKGAGRSVEQVTWPAVGGRRRFHGMGQKLFTMSKMFRSCHDIVM
jgi:hypothetical protein